MKGALRLLLLVCFLSASPSLFGWIDLEERAQEFVLESKQIQIPGYRDAFNPSIIRWKGELLLSFRIRDPLTLSTDGIGFIWLDEDFQAKGDVVRLKICHENTLLPKEYSSTPSFAQDPRMVVIGEQLYIVYSNILKLAGIQIRRMFMGKVSFNGESFFLEQPEALLYFEGSGKQLQEKNWAPFVYNDELLLSAKLMPHRVLQPFSGSYCCNTMGSTMGQIVWEWGELRGGTQAFIEGDEYLGFFHSYKDIKTSHSAGKKISHYFMGAYTFVRHPPFAITRLSPEPIIGKGFYTAPEYKTWKPLRVVFPGGFISDEQHIWIAYGKQDHEVWIVKLDKKGLFNSLIPITTLEQAL